MKLSRIALAAAALAATGSAFAVVGAPASDILHITGSSATGINVAKSLSLLCDAAAGAPNSLTIYKQTTTTDTLGNVWTADCAVKFVAQSTTAGAAKVYSQVRVNTAGSASAITAITTATTFVDPAAITGSNNIAAAGSLGFLSTLGQLKSVTAGTVSETSDGGFLDVEPAMFTAIGNTIAVPVASQLQATKYLQTFGIAVSSQLYNALQAYQVAKGQLSAACATASANGVDGNGNPITLYTATGDTTPACQPSISRAQVAAYLSTANNLAKKAGVNFLFGSTAAAVANDLPSTAQISPSPAAGTKIAYVRRNNSSGTYVGSIEYFLNNPIGGTTTVGGSLAATGSNTTGTTTNVSLLAAYTATGSGDVVSVLNDPVTKPTAAPLNTAYAFAPLSAENNPIGTSDAYRFVKLNNNYIADGVAGAGQTAEAQAGRYDYVYELVKYGASTATLGALNAIENALAAGQSSPGLFLTTESSFSRGGVRKNTNPYGVFK
ncbi:MAG: hypothetical protein EPO12_07075 [Aquabacterium sp.]|nr:MAG: hypothetical protein EPO12_07075 [Aquabacterium sp.]